MTIELIKYIKEGKIPRENHRGNIEYKCFLSIDDDTKINKLVTQMKWRLAQGYELYNKKYALYVIGVYDNGRIANIDNETLSKTLQILDKVCKECNAKIKHIYNHKKDNIQILKITCDDMDEYYPLF